MTISGSFDLEDSVLKRYQDGAREVQPSLCCPTTYEENDLAFLPEEIIAKDYGCGDPTQYVNAGETVLDLGSGAGKNCYIIARKVGATGKAIGVDFNDEMLDLARRYQGAIAREIGFDNTKFVKGKIQDLTLDLDAVQAWLRDNPIATLDDWRRFDSEIDRLRREQPLIADNSCDAVVSNCVLNLVHPSDKEQLFKEIFRVLKQGGRAIISDITCDENPGEEILNDPDLWSGCIAGAFREDEFLKRFERAGFYGIEILKRESKPWRIVNGIEFRSMTVRAYKGKEGECLERNQAVIYRGPWKKVEDDDGHTYYRGERMAVCDKTFNILTRSDSPYASDIIPVLPHEEIPLESAEQFACKSNAIRDPRETKGQDYRATVIDGDNACCSTDSCC